MPKIADFLRSQCPRTVGEFKRRFGEPRMDMANEAAREYSLWSVDGSPALDIDYLMLYANVIKNQVLYVYAREGAVTHVAVVDPTDWRPSDFKPQAGRPFLSPEP
ncbi:MAG: hypothetical protein ACE5JR_13575 [Gemmatimonadota bacterium]